MRKSRKHYEQLLDSFPDVVTLPDFCKMLGGIGERTARKLLKKNCVKHYFIRHTYFIPNIWVIDYVLSDYCNEYKKA
ncbi:MAG TPA: hypothetical protein DCQ14_05145 [Firmicutes bacterium]|nr:hypothetical protein [Bacillota bacterium]